MKNSLLFIPIILSFLVFLSGCSETALDANKPITIHFIDVGDSNVTSHGDAILITERDKNILIDGGESDKAYLVVDLLKSLNISKVDYVIATHPHSDHIDGLVDVMKEFEVGDVFYNGKSSNQSEEFDAEMRKHNYSAVSKGDIINVSDSVYLEVLHPSKEFSSGTNNTGENDKSLVIKLFYKNVSFLFTGDCEKACNDYLLKNSELLKSDVLKIGHHGDSSSSAVDFLKAVNPKIAVITPGAHDIWGMPNEECIDNINDAGIMLYSTAYGDITISTNGVDINVSESIN
jgi:competence protein ComEC